jgi:hypothetical protein
MRHSVIGWKGDNFYFVWLIEWVQRSLLVLHQSPLSVPQLNYPEGWNLAYSEMAPAMVLMALPFSILGGPVLGYNVSLLFSFILSGLFVYLWVCRLTGKPAAAIVAGAIFAFCPFRMSHLLGHLQLMGTQWFPLYFMSLSALIEGSSRPRRDLALCVSSFGLIAFTSQYYLYMTLIITFVFVASLWLVSDRGLWHGRRTWRELGLVCAFSLPLLAISVLPYLSLAREEKLPWRPLEEVRRGSASPTDLLLPTERQLVWGAPLGKTLEPRWRVERTLYLGLVSMALAGVAVFSRRRTGSGDGRIQKAILMTAAAAFILALGTDLHWMGSPVRLPRVLQSLSPFSDGGVPLPGYLLFKYLPFYKGMRVWMRYGIFVSLFVSVLSGIGMAVFLEKLSGWKQRIAGLIMLALVLVDFYPAYRSLTVVRGRDVDFWLASRAGPGAVAQFPARQLGQPEQGFYTSIHGKPFLGGFFNGYRPLQFRRIFETLQPFPDDRSVALLRELGVRWVIVDSAQYPDFPNVERQIEALGLRRLENIKGEHVFAVP